jgi:hypothetical protein
MGRAFAKLDHAKAVADRVQFQAEIQERAAALKAAETQFQALSEDVNRAMNQAKELLKEAKEIMDLRPDEPLSEKALKNFEELPGSIAELTQEIFQEEARAECASTETANVSLGTVCWLSAAAHWCNSARLCKNMKPGRKRLRSFVLKRKKSVMP